MNIIYLELLEEQKFYNILLACWGNFVRAAFSIFTNKKISFSANPKTPILSREKVDSCSIHEAEQEYKIQSPIMTSLSHLTPPKSRKVKKYQNGKGKKKVVERIK